MLSSAAPPTARKRQSEEESAPSIQAREQTWSGPLVATPLCFGTPPNEGDSNANADRCRSQHRPRVAVFPRAHDVISSSTKHELDRGRVPLRTYVRSHRTWLVPRL